jgi:hypothetical protein
MPEETSEENILQTNSTEVTGNFSPPREQLEVEEGSLSDDNINYPAGPKLWLTMTSMCIAYFLNGLVSCQKMKERMGN